jgi:hypothetical protein
MIRPAWLAVLAVVLIPSQSLAQMGGMMSGMGGVGGMGGMMGGRQWLEQDRMVKIEMTGGQSVSGKLHLGPVSVDSDVGLYAINPEKLKMIRFSKRAEGGAKEVEVRSPFNPETSPFTAIAGTVVTTSNKEITGQVRVPSWTLEIDDGALSLVSEKLKTITFTAEPEGQPAEKTGAKDPGGSYSRHQNTVVLNSPGGDRVTFVDLGTKKTASVRLSESKKSGLKIVPIEGPDVAAVMVSGPKVTRIAAANRLTGVWHTQELREPVKMASPIVGPGVAAYGLGRYIYAYSASAQRWDVLELPKGSHATPIVGPNYVKVEVANHYYTFDCKTAQWNHVDIGALLESADSQETDKPKN